MRWSDGSNEPLCPTEGGTGQFVSRFVVTEGIAELLQFRYGKAIPMVGKRQEFEFVRIVRKKLAAVTLLQLAWLQRPEAFWASLPLAASCIHAEAW